MKIFVLGASGFLGKALVPVLLEKGHDVSGLVYSSEEKFTFPTIRANAIHPGYWQNHVTESDIIINLAGHDIAQPWTRSVKKEIYRSRVDVTKNIVEAFSQNNHRKMLINTSAVGYYGFCDDRWKDESAAPGRDFLATLCQDWEKYARQAEDKNISVLIMRLGIVLGKGGTLEKMIQLFRRFMGSRLGSGKQWFSWIHIDDFISFILMAIEQKLSGSYNIVSPTPVTNSELTKVIADTLRVPTFLPAPAFALKMALGEFANVILQGQRVSPTRLQQQGFPFKFPHIREAIESLVSS